MIEVIAPLGFTEPLDVRLKFHANDRSGDVLNTKPRAARIQNGRTRTKPPSLDVEGFMLVQHKTKLDDFFDPEKVELVYGEEIRKLVQDLSGADHVEISGEGVLRFGESSNKSGAYNNSRPARFVHIDTSDAGAKILNQRHVMPEGRSAKRIVQYNVWRVLSQPPQDVPLAVCEAHSVDPKDFVFADALLDRDGKVELSFESVLLQYNPAQRWVFFNDMRPDEALVFKTNDSRTDPGLARFVPHGAFDNPQCPPGTPPRSSIEMRAAAFWYD